MVESSSRRQFLQVGTIVGLAFITKDFVSPPIAKADSNSIDKYHLFLPYQIAKYGGKQNLILKNGDTYSLDIPSRISENQELPFDYNHQRINVILHSLYENEYNNLENKYSFHRQVNDAINKSKFMYSNTSEYCKLADTSENCQLTLQYLETGKPIYLENLSLLDYIVSTSKLDEKIIKRYQIASNNYKISLIEDRLFPALKKSQYEKTDRENISTTYWYVKSLQPVTSFELLDILNDIIANQVDLPLELKIFYSQASAISRASTVDIFVSNFIESETDNYDRKLEVYQNLRDGEEISEEQKLTLEDLTKDIINSETLPQEVQATYLLTVQEFQGEDWGVDTQKVLDIFNRYQEVKESAKDSFKNGKALSSEALPLVSRGLSALGVKAGTGAAVSTLTGAAATNATLAWLGGGSVAAGGAGMLGGLVVVTGGAALVGAAGVLSLMAISEMDGEDRINLIKAGITSVFAGTGAVGLAWLAASSLGVAGSATGAAAISSTIAALGGLSVMTGGASLVASVAAGFLMGSLSSSNKKRDNDILHKLEIYSYIAAKNNNDPFVQYIEKNFDPTSYKDDKLHEFYFAADLDLETLTSAMNTVAKKTSFEVDEKIVVFIDCTTMDELKEGIILTNKRYMDYTIMDGYIYFNDITYQSLTKAIASESGRKLWVEDAKDVKYVQEKFANFLLKLKQEKLALSI